MCLTGVDYFSTLGYQPSIAFQNAGMLAPIATIVLVLVTLFGALPVYSYVAGVSPHGQGSIGMLEKLMRGWGGKFLVLTLLGFAATDFVITKTLSAADATAHLVENPFWPIHPHDEVWQVRQKIAVTCFLLMLLAAMFLRGFREVIGLAVGIVGVYLLLNLIIVLVSMHYLLNHTDKLWQWYERLLAGNEAWFVKDAPLTGGGWFVIIATALLVFPKLALGLSGFETGVAVMPLIKGDETDTEDQPAGRVRNTRKLLVTAAVIMSVFLLTTAVLVCTLIPPEAFKELTPQERLAAEHGGPKIPTARDRALAYIAHDDIAHADKAKSISPLFGPVFGTIYDISTIVILWFAGASAMAGLLNLVPQYLPRYGMAPEWAKAVRPLVLLFTGINFLVTVIFSADVEAQGGAYATGVLVLILSACVASVIDIYRNRAGTWTQRVPWGFAFISLVFLYTTIANIIEKPDGLKIASFFIVAIIVSSVVSRAYRSRELRFSGFIIDDTNSKFLWESIKALEVPVLVPHRPGRRSLADKEALIRRHHRLTPEVPILFVEIRLRDASEFLQKPWLRIQQEEGRFIIKIDRAASIAHAVTAVALELGKYGKPPEIHCGWPDESPVTGTLGFLLFGEGNVPWMIHELIRRAETDPHKRPMVVIAGP
jgi:hypothetical protein